MGQIPVDAKENEVVAIPKLLGLIDVRKRIVTIGAIGCQKEIARTIIGGGGDDLLRVKDNRPALARGMRDFFLDAEKDGFPGKHWEYTEETDGDHGRVEVRRVWACEDIN
ncbi:MAG: ISAs1 family transposase, partial [Myxococcales bacterium]|nr:ISAs1 family transposase [Myxococcales bacterium]